MTEVDKGELARGVLASVQSVLKLRELNSRDQAEAAFRRAEALYGRVAGPDHSKVKRTLRALLEGARLAVKPEDRRRVERALERAREGIR